MTRSERLEEIRKRPWLSPFEVHAANRFEEWCQTPLTEALRNTIMKAIADGEAPLLRTQDDGRKCWGVTLPEMHPFVAVTFAKKRKLRLVTILPPDWVVP